jgi:microcystin-dependent protein
MSSLKLNPLLTKAIYNEEYPIGRTVIFYDNEDHSNFLGFTWERTATGKTPVGIDTTDTDFNEIGKIGGEKEHTLIVDEIPSHSHGFKSNTDYSARGSWATGRNGDPSYGFQRTLGDSSFMLFDLDKTGGGKAHNNLQPYEVFAFWKRIA